MVTLGITRFRGKILQPPLDLSKKPLQLLEVAMVKDDCCTSNLDMRLPVIGLRK
jgi:hypothetical protein